MEIFSAQNQLDGLLKGNPFTLGVSTGKAQELRAEIETVVEWNYLARNEDGSFVVDEEGNRKWSIPSVGAARIDRWQLSSITNALDKFETVFAEEMREGCSYHIPQRGITSVVALVEHGRASVS